MSTIAIYGRLRPSAKPSEKLDVTVDEPNVVKITVNGETSQGTDSRVQYNFRFSKLFGPSTPQEEVFSTVGLKICDRFLDGYNGTIFAYGQTGSGKTYTIEGGSKKFADRGLLPRSLHYIYQKLVERSDEKITMQVTYLEIYNDSAYDLLSASSGANSRLPKVSVSDRSNGCQIHGLSSHVAPNEDVAQSLLFLGRTNRTVAKTSMNLASSRSHSVFTVTLTAQKPGSEVITKSKLHLVDLAGSERVAKSQAKGTQLTEAKHINLSLHYLEAVIIALQSSAQKRHVPYRNSLLTKLLRDSLGGNCLTAMIANLSQADSNIPETVSTCRFAQRVALVSNAAVRNEILDDKTTIRRLRKRIAELQAELAVAQQVGRDANAVEEEAGGDVDRDKLNKQMRSFYRGRLKDPLTVASSAAAIRACFGILRDMLREQANHIEALEDIAQESERKDERIKELKSKFGVTRARMRNMESSMVVTKASGYGSVRRSRSLGATKRGAAAASSTSLRGNGTPSLPGVSGRGQDKRQRTRSQEKAEQTRQLVHRSQQKLASQQETRRHATLAMAKKRLKQLHQAEVESKRALQVVTERLRHQQDVLQYCEQRAPHRLLDEKYTERELEQEQVKLATRLGEIRRVRKEMELNQSMLETTALSRGKTEPALGTPTPPAGGARRRGPRESTSRGALPDPRRSSGEPTSKVDAELARRQQELATKEAATRQKLLLLKQQLRRESTYTQPLLPERAQTSHSIQSTASAPGWATTTRPLGSTPRSSTSAMASAPHLQHLPQHQQQQQQATPAHHNLQAMSRLLAEHPEESGTSSSEDEDEDGDSSDDGQPRIGSAARVASRPVSKDPESAYLTAMEAQKSRISRIRETIRAVEVIQGAWRQYRRRRQAWAGSRGKGKGKGKGWRG